MTYQLLLSFGFITVLILRQTLYSSVLLGGLVARDLLHSRDLCHRIFNSIHTNRVCDGVQTLAAIMLWVFGCAFYWVFHNRPDSKESFYSGVQDMALDVKINIYERMLTQKIVHKQK